MTVDITKIHEMISERDKLKKQCEELSTKLSDLNVKIQKGCPHPAEKIDRHYHEGGYDYVSSVTVVHTCVICKKTLKSYDDPNHKGYHA